MNVRNDDVDGLTGDVEAVLGVDLEEVRAHEGEDGDAVVQDVLRIGGRRLGQNEKSSRLRVRVLASSAE